MDGLDLYRALGLESKKAMPRQIKAAFRAAARRHHPDKGGDQQAFARVQKAYETLGDPEAREAYDAWQAELQWRYLPVRARRQRGREGARSRAVRAPGARVERAARAESWRALHRVPPRAARACRLPAELGFPA